MKTFPDSFDIKSRIRSLIIGVLFLFALGFVASLVAYSYWLLPDFIDSNVRHASLMDQYSWANRQLYSMRIDLLELIEDQCRTVIDIAKNYEDGKELEDSLQSALKLKYVQDGFWLDFSKMKGMTVEGLLPLDTLLQIASTYRKQRTVDYDKINEAISGVRYQSFRTKGMEYLLIIRDMKPRPHLQADEAIGLVIDYRALLKDFSQRLESEYLTITGKPVPYRNEKYDYFGQAKGILKEGDTLWWYGSRTTPIVEYDWDDKGWRHSGCIDMNRDLGLTFMARSMKLTASEISPYYSPAELSVIFVLKLARFGTFVVILVLLLLVILIVLIRRRHARNQIALAHLAHAVKTPVARLKLAAETLTEGRVVSPEEESAMLKAVTRECDRLDRAVQNAALSLEKGRLEFNLQSGDLAGLVNNIAESWKPSFDNSKLELKVVLPEGPAGTLIARYDSALLPVALDNLIDNALRHTRLRMTPPTPPAIAGGESKQTAIAGGESEDCQPVAADSGILGSPTVTISLTYDSVYAILTVDDSGDGIPKSERNRLFKPFTGSAKDPKSGATGLGLGLALVKAITEGHKGTVRVGEAPGGGARFEVRLPINS